MNKKDKLKFAGRFIGGGLFWIIAVMMFTLVGACAIYGFFWVVATILAVDVQALMQVTLWSILLIIIFIIGGLWATRTY